VNINQATIEKITINDYAMGVYPIWSFNLGLKGFEWVMQEHRSTSTMPQHSIPSKRI